MKFSVKQYLKQKNENENNKYKIICWGIQLKKKFN